MKQFNIPAHYRSSVIGKIKSYSKLKDPRKKDFSPVELDLGPVRFLFARHFGFCYGVENAIEISYRAIEENPGKRIFLLSQMIHNPEVNRDLEEQGIQFLMDTEGNPLLPLDILQPEDIVIIPAFGTTLEMEQMLKEKGVNVASYNTTCPFVEKVWNRSAKIGEEGYSIVIHGKERHEETRATFSHSMASAPSIVIRDMSEAEDLARFISGEMSRDEFERLFRSRCSPGFEPEKDLQRIGVVNQTTMLATETQAISDYLKQAVIRRFGEENYRYHFADTRDTLCYATNDNQQSTYALLDRKADLAIVVGGYNSSNTSHLVELCETKLPSYFIQSAEEIHSAERIHHFDIHLQQRVETEGYLSGHTPITIILTSGASCPDRLVEEVLQKLLSFFPTSRNPEEALKELVPAS